MKLEIFSTLHTKKHNISVPYKPTLGVTFLDFTAVAQDDDLGVEELASKARSFLLSEQRYLVGCL